MTAKGRGKSPCDRSRIRKNSKGCWPKNGGLHDPSRKRGILYGERKRCCEKGKEGLLEGSVISPQSHPEEKGGGGGGGGEGSIKATSAENRSKKKSHHLERICEEAQGEMLRGHFKLGEKSRKELNWCPSQKVLYAEQFGEELPKGDMIKEKQHAIKSGKTTKNVPPGKELG